MTRPLRLAAALAGALLLPAAGAAAPTGPARLAAEVRPADARVTIPVEGMTCGGCVENVTGTLQKVPGVKAVAVSLERKRAEVTYDAAKVTAKALVEAIRGAGYEPGVPVAN